jgi:hypothetical protein
VRLAFSPTCLKSGYRLSDQIIVQYIGFSTKGLVRAYTFSVRAAAGDPREYTLTIANEAFESRRARYQDAPEICSMRLRRELAENADGAATQFSITDAELADYQGARKPKPSRGGPAYRKD